MLIFFAGRYEDALSSAAAAFGQQPKFLAPQYILAACHAMSGRVQEAREVCARAMQLDPTLRISGMKDRGPNRRPEDIEKLVQAFRVAGVPE